MNRGRSARAGDAMLSRVHRRKSLLELKYLAAQKIKKDVLINNLTKVFLFQVSVPFALRKRRAFRFWSTLFCQGFRQVKCGIIQCGHDSICLGRGGSLKVISAYTARGLEKSI